MQPAFILRIAIDSHATTRPYDGLFTVAPSRWYPDDMTNTPRLQITLSIIACILAAIAVVLVLQLQKQGKKEIELLREIRDEVNAAGAANEDGNARQYEVLRRMENAGKRGN